MYSAPAPVSRKRVGEQIQDARAGDHVERGGRLVEDEQFRPGREGGGDQHALLLAARDLVRVAAQDRGRVTQADMA